MSLADTLNVVVKALDAAGIPHMLAGSLASTYHGEPRATQDIDIVVDPPSREALDHFVASLSRDRFYVGDHRAAFAQREPFNVIDTSTGWKVDLIVRRDRAYSHAELERREPADIEGIPVYVATAEDTILTKLEWAKMGESERQLRDVEASVRARGDSLDRSYLIAWATELGVLPDLERALKGLE
jgi:hypothetical protein